MSTYSSQLLGGDGAISVLVEQGECLLELSDLLFGQLISLERKNGKNNILQRLLVSTKVFRCVDLFLFLEMFICWMKKCRYKKIKYNDKKRNLMT